MTLKNFCFTLSPFFHHFRLFWPLNTSPFNKKALLFFLYSSKSLLVLEKLRAICQSHPDYTHKNIQTNRARDFYDIEQIYTKVLNEGKVSDFFKELSRHIVKVFKAKEVPLSLIDSCLNSEEFLKSQEIGWQEVQSTVRGLNQKFSYYVQTLKDIVKRINPK